MLCHENEHVCADHQAAVGDVILTSSQVSKFQASNSYSGFRYRLSTQKTSHIKATEACRAENASLLEVRNGSIGNFIYRLFSQAGLLVFK